MAARLFNTESNSVALGPNWQLDCSIKNKKFDSVLMSSLAVKDTIPHPPLRINPKSSLSFISFSKSGIYSQCQAKQGKPNRYFNQPIFNHFLFIFAKSTYPGLIITSLPFPPAMREPTIPPFFVIFIITIQFYRYLLSLTLSSGLMLFHQHGQSFRCHVHPSKRGIAIFPQPSQGLQLRPFGRLST